MTTDVEVYSALKYRIEVSPVTGTHSYYNSANQLHREGGPAIEWPNGSKEWCQNGLRHRTDGPAIEYASGKKEWYQNGLRHRTDGPAMTHPDGTSVWYQNGRLHRENGPACVWSDGGTEWWQNGQRHRIDGAAVEWVSYQEWWIMACNTQNKAIAHSSKLWDTLYDHSCRTI